MDEKLLLFEICKRDNLGVAIGFFGGGFYIVLFFLQLRFLNFFRHNHLLQPHALAVHRKLGTVNIHISQYPGNQLGGELQQEQFDMVPIRFGVRYDTLNPGKNKRFIFKVNQY